MEIEYDAAKDRSNRRKHGIGLAVARALFANPYLEERDDRFPYGEERYIATGIVGTTVLVCVYSVRGKAVRVISIRRATRGEASAYYQAYGS